jgi:uncharacterized protein
MKTENVMFESQGQKLAGILHVPERSKPPFVVASHGLLSGKGSEKYVALADRLDREGIALLRFDYRGCGESEGNWEDSTVTGRIADLQAAIAFVASHPKLGGRMGLLGSSLGGYIALIAGSGDLRVTATVTWSTPFHLDGLESPPVEGFPPLGKRFFEDLPNHRLHPLLPAVSNCMVIHGEADEIVPFDQSWEIFQSLGSPKEIHVLEQADHRFMNPLHRTRVMDLTARWFKTRLDE